eukprot:TRINITY_DN90795_c0_g1_i1.p1 TRINITY_DN90795_c0_g1~~TRINITY_DN90795_c0_g1_i1.p1  ORF type:complete len:1298 (+),score=324.29 TRINITY_DN90795_c0_g1_i1:109-4002(+)
MAGPDVGKSVQKKKKRGQSSGRGDDSERATPRVKKKERAKQVAPQIETRKFADNEYTGILQSVQGARYLEGLGSKYTWKNGVVYEGPFVQSTIVGKGKFLWPDGSVYEGELLNGLRHGEGCHVLADGVTKYNGQWMQGKRWGHGRISYSHGGDVYYEGAWEDDMKHGQGKQVWPNGNCYEGEWRRGAMAGYGCMIFSDGGQLETYRGHWEDNQPHGVGTHIWHSPAPRLDNFKELLPSQQMNNRYEGEWQYGVRHGTGTFYYADGARYSGEWVENVKHGEGCYTYDDGRVYRGSFAYDQMQHGQQGMGGLKHDLTGIPSPAQSEKAASPGATPRNEQTSPGHMSPSTTVQQMQPPPLLSVQGAGSRPHTAGEHTSSGKGNNPANIGGTDNPVRRCIDISDLEAVALPKDVESLTRITSSGTQVDSPASLNAGEAMREVHNMLLRHLGDLKQFYAQYRVVCPSGGVEADPFVLNLQQLWCFARDMELLSPCCSLSRLNRLIFSGPRHHQEVAAQDQGDLRPVTPRLPEVALVRRVSREINPTPAGRSSEGVSDGKRSAQDRPVSAGGASTVSRAQSRASEYPETEFEGRSSPELGAGTEAGSEYGALSELPEEDEEDDGSFFHSKSASRRCTRLTTLQSGVSVEAPFELPVFSKFWRQEGTSDLSDIHLPGTSLIFRHFLESIVRIALARYPNDCGLEVQLRRLLKVNFADHRPTARSMGEIAWATMAEPSMTRAFADHEEELWALFKGMAVGEGSYKPMWNVALGKEESNLNQSRHMSAADISRQTASSDLHPNPEEDVDFLEGSKKLKEAIEGTAARLTTAEQVERERERQAAMLAQNAAMEAAQAAARDALRSRRHRRRGFGGQTRRLQVKARLDVTVRVKDLLLLLRQAGFLRASPGPGHPASDPERTLPDPYGAIFPADASKRPSTTGREAGMTPIDDLANLGDFLGGGGPFEKRISTMSNGTASAAPLLGAALDLGLGQAKKAGLAIQASHFLGASVFGGASVSRRNSVGSESRKSPRAASRPEKGPEEIDEVFSEGHFAVGNHGIGAEAAVLAKAAEAAESAVTGQDEFGKAIWKEECVTALKRCDFSVASVDLLRILMEVLPPASLNHLRWSCKGAENPTEEQVPLLEFIETELTFAEFRRVLMRIADEQTQAHISSDIEVVQKMALHMRVDGFLRHVFLPALQEPWVPPAPVEEPAAPESRNPSGKSAQEGGDAVPAEEPPAEEAHDGVEAEGATEPPPPPPEPPVFWLGFDTLHDEHIDEIGGDREEREEANATRMWPVWYLEEVTNW